jgi:hypothetical protein
VLLAGANLLLLGHNLLRVARQAGRPGVALNAQTRHVRRLARTLPPRAWVVSDLDLLFLASELPGRTVLPLRRSQPWARALAWRDWRRHHPEGSYAAFRARYRAGNLPAGELTAPPAEDAIPLLAAALRRGVPLFVTSYNDLRRRPLLQRFGRQPRHRRPPPYTWRLTPSPEVPPHGAGPR